MTSNVDMPACTRSEAPTGAPRGRRRRDGRALVTAVVVELGAGLADVGVSLADELGLAPPQPDAPSNTATLTVSETQDRGFRPMRGDHGTVAQHIQRG